MVDVQAGAQAAALEALQTLETLRQHNPQMRCWFLTAGASPSDTAELLARGATGVLAKPLGSNYQLARKLKRLAKGLPPA